MAELVKGTILTPEGEEVVPTILFTDEEARLLRDYKRFLQRYGLRSATFCSSCAEASDLGEAYRGRPHGCEFFVTDVDIVCRCRCRNRFYRGQTF